jgi:hypothetical protein
MGYDSGIALSLFSSMWQPVAAIFLVTTAGPFA